MNDNHDYSDAHSCRELIWTGCASSSSRTFSIRITLIDSFDTETTLRGECRDVSLNRVEDSLAVISLPERRHESFALNLTDKSIRQIAFKMTAHLREVLAILNRNHQQKAALSPSFDPIPQPRATASEKSKMSRSPVVSTVKTAYSILPRSLRLR